MQHMVFVDGLAVAQYLRDARIAANITQDELAVQLGVSQSLVSKIENNQHRVSISEFIRFARALGLNPSAAIDELEHRMPHSEHHHKTDAKG